MYIADSNSMHPLLHAALGDSDYSCFQANFDEAVFCYNQSRPNENDAGHGCARSPLATTALALHS